MRHQIQLTRQREAKTFRWKCSLSMGSDIRHLIESLLHFDRNIRQTSHMSAAKVG